MVTQLPRRDADNHLSETGDALARHLPGAIASTAHGSLSAI